MEIKDLAGLSEPFKRLIEVILQGIGAVSQPYLICKNAEARAYEIRVISAALAEVADNHTLPVIYKNGEIELWQKPDDHTLILESRKIDERSNLRLDYQERKKQANIESVTSIAAVELANDDSVPDEKPDEDWTTRFFSSVQDVSSEQMQNLWGRILAGEIRRPGTYSLRTLDFVRNLSKTEAELVAMIGKLAVQAGGLAFVDIHDKTWLETNRSVVDGHHFQLGELDILYPSDLSIRVFRDASVEEHIFLCGERMLILKRGEITNEISIPVWKFTTVGQELLPLVPSNIDDEYLEHLGRFFVQQNGKAFLASITYKHPNGEVHGQIIREILAEPTK
jgi:hypothetical protein